MIKKMKNLGRKRGEKKKKESELFFQKIANHEQNHFKRV